MKMTDLPGDPKELDRNQMAMVSRLNSIARLKNTDDFIHKGDRGHAALFAGSKGMMGATVLALTAALRSGCGKVTGFVDESFHSMIHGTCPEVLIQSKESIALNINSYDAFGIGPGLGVSSNAKSALLTSLSTSVPLILDADALNILSLEKELISQLPPGAILTPHVGEWQRLFGPNPNWKSRIEHSVESCIKLKINILIKGNYSVFITSKGTFFINGTGNHGMAKGGSGDVLTGLMCGLLAQGYDAESAGILGMYVHGLAGDLAAETIGHDAMLPSDIVSHLHAAFKSLRNSRPNT